MKNVILFHPSVGYMDKLRTKPSLPLNLLSAANLVSKDYKVIIVDERIEYDWKQKIKNLIDENTICVGVTSLTGKMILSGLEFSKFIKQISNKIPVVWGGVHPTLVPQQTLQNKYIDIVVLGEAEKTFYDLVCTLDKGLPLDNVNGICYKVKDEIRFTKPQEFLDLNTLPEIPYHLVDIENYLPLYKGRKSLYFESSRGCPFKCSYCYNNVFNKRRWRALSSYETIRRIKNIIKKYPFVEDIYFVDDNFFVDLKRAKEIVKELSYLGITWQVQGVDIVSLKHMDEEFFTLLEKSKLSRLTIGIESGSPKIRKIMNKQGSVKDILDVFKKLSKYNITIYSSFLVGIPCEEIKDIRQTVNLLFTLFRINKNLRNSPFYIYTPYPGTEMYYLVEKEKDLPKNLEDWAYCEWDSIKHKNVKKFYENLHFVTLFLDNKVKEYQTRFLLLKILFYIYRPIARFRVRFMFFHFMIEKIFFDLFRKILKV